MANLTEGAVVQLKSGGQVMTIGYIGNEGRTATCYWFDRNGEFQRHDIRLVALMPESSDAGSHAHT